LFDALILKLFGTDFWALVAGPLIFYALMLLLGAIIAYQLAGWGQWYFSIYSFSVILTFPSFSVTRPCVRSPEWP